MKHVIILILLINATSAFGQVVQELKILPEFPIEGDSLFLEMHVSTGQLGTYFGANVLQNISTEITEVYTCFVVGPLQEPQSFFDKIYLGTAKTGNLRINFNIRRTFDDNCEIGNITSTMNLEKEVWYSNFDIIGNPITDGELLIKSRRSVQKLEIYNSLGQVCLTENYGSEKILNPNVSTLNNGVYFILLIFDDLQIASKKIIVKK